MPVDFDGSQLSPEQSAALVDQTLLSGGLLSDWWRSQRNDYVTKVMNTVRVSMANGESTTQAASRLIGGTVQGVQYAGVIQATRRQASALAASAISAIQTAARLDTFTQNSDVVKGYQQVSTLDNKTSDICIAYSGQAWDLDGIPIPPSTLPFNGGPPRHFNCRSTLVPVIKSFDELGLGDDEFDDDFTRASMDGQVPGNITFSDWLNKKPLSFQDDLLGPARAGLWRSQKITLTQLVDMRGNPMTVRQLTELVESER